LNRSSDELKDVQSAGKFGYDVVLATNEYHLVRNRRSKYNNEDSMMILPNRSISVEGKLPRFKMNLQTNRPPNLVSLNEARLLNINRDPAILSSVKKVPTTDFRKQGKPMRHKCMINNTN